MSDQGASRVGYKRPPQHSKFKPGQSGNPGGRAKGARNLETDLAQELSEKIPIREGERCLKVSKQRALLKSLVAKALKGDTRAAGLILQLLAKIVAVEEIGPKQKSEPLSAEETAILERFVAKRIAEHTINDADRRGAREDCDDDRG
jgi:hypothetical protein